MVTRMRINIAFICTLRALSIFIILCRVRQAYILVECTNRKQQFTAHVCGQRYDNKGQYHTVLSVRVREKMTDGKGRENIRVPDILKCFDLWSYHKELH